MQRQDIHIEANLEMLLFDDQPSWTLTEETRQILMRRFLEQRSTKQPEDEKDSEGDRTKAILLHRELQSVNGRPINVDVGTQGEMRVKFDLLDGRAIVSTDTTNVYTLPLHVEGPVFVERK